MKIVIELPYPLPTWNRILAMHPFARKKMRDLIHDSISELQAIETGDMTRTVYRLKPSWMESFGAAYFMTIRPKSSDKLRSGRKSARRRGR